MYALQPCHQCLALTNIFMATNLMQPWDLYFVSPAQLMEEEESLLSVPLFSSSQPLGSSSEPPPCKSFLSDSPSTGDYPGFVQGGNCSDHQQSKIKQSSLEGEQMSSMRDPYAKRQQQAPGAKG
ncbi:uncharacterized protein WM294_011504 [Sarcoramphus papa]